MAEDDAKLKVKLSAEGAEEVSGALDKVKDKAGGLGGAFKSASHIAVAAFQKIAEGAKYVFNKLNSSAEEISKLTQVSNQMRLPTGEVAEMAELFRRSGMSFAQMSVQAYAMEQAVNNVEKQPIFEKLKLNQTNLKLDDTKTRMYRILDALKQVDNASERASMARQVFGFRSQFTGQLIERFKETQEEAEKTVSGYKEILNKSSYTIQQAKLGFDALFRQVDYFWAGILSEISPYLNQIVDDLSAYGEKFAGAGVAIGKWIAKAFENAYAFADILHGAFEVFMGGVGVLVTAFNVFRLIGSGLTVAFANLRVWIVKLLDKVGIISGNTAREWKNEAQFSLDRAHEEDRNTLRDLENSASDTWNHFGKGFELIFGKSKKVARKEEGPSFDENNYPQEEQQEALPEFKSSQIGLSSSHLNVGGYATAVESAVAKAGFSIQERSLQTQIQSLNVQQEMLNSLKSIQTNIGDIATGYAE